MNTLHKRLTFLYTITTGSILLLVITAFFLSSIRENRSAQLEQFQVIWNSLSSRFLSSNTFSHGYLAQTEADYQMIIHISENGTPFLYQGSWRPETDRQTLIQSAADQAEAEGVFMNHAPISSTITTSSLITIEGEHNDSYNAMVMVVAVKNGVRSLCAISYIPPVRESLGDMVLYLCFLAIAGILALGLISWKFVGWSLKPVEESQRKQAQFIAAASHELRSPLAVLRSAVAALGNDSTEKDTLLPVIDSECVRMSRLIDDMLLLASADAKTWSLQMQTIDMDTLLIDLYESFQPSCLEKGITLCLQLPETALPPVSGDPQRIRQLLLVLLDNAKNYTPTGRSICIRAQASLQKPALALQVIDEGCGIPDEYKPYIFDRFYQADSSRNDKQHFGLGLSIARELVLLHHGTITLTDSEKGGSCFTVELPCLYSSSRSLQA